MKRQSLFTLLCTLIALPLVLFGAAWAGRVAADTTSSLVFTKVVASVSDTNADGLVNAGDVIHYSYTLTNTSSANGLHNIAVTDSYSSGPVVPVSSCPTSLTKSSVKGNSGSCTEDYTITAADVAAGQVMSTGVANAKFNSSNAAVTSNSVTTTTATNNDSGGGGGTTESKILLIMLENTPSSKITPSSMPYLSSLMSTYAIDDNYSALTHPSTPNYLAIGFGNTYSLADDCVPSVCGVNDPSVFDQALANGKTAKVYADGMQNSNGSPTTCRATDGSKANTADLYAVRHTIWPYALASINRASCGQYDVSELPGVSTPLETDSANGTLPDVGYLAPNLLDDGHAGAWNPGPSLTPPDNYLKAMIPNILAGPDWQSGKLTIVITEDEGAGKNQIIPFVVINHTLPSGLVIHTALNHYALNHWMSRLGGGSGLQNGLIAPDAGAAFGL